MAVAEIKLGQIAVQVGFADVLVFTVNSALQDREKTFNGIGVDVAPHVFVFAVGDSSVRRKIPAYANAYEPGFCAS